MNVLKNLKSGLNFIDITEESKSPLSNNKVISLFSGAGGLDLGLEDAGFDTAVCVEIDADCRETLRFNRPKWKLAEDTKGGRAAGDINYISAEEILSLGNLRKGEAALVVGGAPCQSFSNIGKRDGVNSETNGTLFIEFLRIVEGTEPAAVLFENVTGITQQKHGEVISTMREKLESLGYKVSYTVLNSANYGVAQRRERFFLLAIKGNETPSFPLPTHYKDKLEWLSVVKDFNVEPNYTPKRWRSLGEVFDKIPTNAREREDFAVMNISEVVRDRMTYISPGENFHVLPMEKRPNCWKNGKHQGTDTFGRLKLDEPSVTIRTAAYNPMKGKYIHPTEDRGLSTHEMAAIQGFPYTWVFKCEKREKITLVSGGKQIGNAVPPPLAEALGKAIKIQLAESQCKIARHINSACASELTSKESSTAACGVL